MKLSKLTQLTGKTDIYIIDQIMKERYQKGDVILDAGCAEGRNLHWFYLNNFEIYGIDTDTSRLAIAKECYPKKASNFEEGSITCLAYDKNTFNHIICNAVLHFAENEVHFNKMFSELVRVLKPNGSLLIRIASTIGLDGNKPFLQESKTNRKGTFYINRAIIQQLLDRYPLALIEPIKTTNVADERAMTTLVLSKIR